MKQRPSVIQKSVGLLSDPYLFINNDAWRLCKKVTLTMVHEDAGCAEYVQAVHAVEHGDESQLARVLHGKLVSPLTDSFRFAADDQHQMLVNVHSKVADWRLIKNHFRKLVQKINFVEGIIVLFAVLGILAPERDVTGKRYKLSAFPVTGYESMHVNKPINTRPTIEIYCEE